jgi:hypothetical protein
MFAGRLICSWIGALGLAAGAFCQTYVQFSIDGGPFPQSINEKGEIAGTYNDFAGNRHGFVRDPNGTITTFDPPGSLSTGVGGINDEGTITGSYLYEPGLSRAFVRDPKGSFTTFNVLGSSSTGASSINAGGAVTGSYADSNNIRHGFVRRPNGTIISFDPPGSVNTSPSSINAKGEITGLYCSSFTPPEAACFLGAPFGPTHGFLRRPGGEIVSFDAPIPGAVLTSVAGINDAGAIMGNYGLGTDTFFGFVRDPDGKFTNFAPGTITAPRSINNKGAITGSAGSRRTPFSGFVRPPQETNTIEKPTIIFDPPFCVDDFGAPVFDSPTSINDEGVITGYCLSASGPQLGWVRFP